MGIGHSNLRTHLRFKKRRPRPIKQIENVPENLDRSLDRVVRLDDVRVAALLRSLNKVATLHRKAVDAQIEAREKRRNATIERDHSSVCDAKFMDEIQRLSALGELIASEKLKRLRVECQNARDSLGPIEQEGIQAERRWEGEIWHLRQAEEKLYKDFAAEFELAESSSGGLSIIPSSDAETSSDDESERSFFEEIPAIRFGGVRSIASSISIVYTSEEVGVSPETEGPKPQASILGDLIDSPGEGEEINNGLDFESGILNIDETFGPPGALPKRQYAPIELFPHPMIDFTTKREMINDWLENNVFASHFEAIHLYTALRAQLDSEKKKVPSNWAELIIAYWRLDGAANPHVIESMSVLDNAFERRAAKKSEAEDRGGRKQSDGQHKKDRSPVGPIPAIGPGCFSDDRTSLGKQRLVPKTKVPPADFSCLLPGTPTTARNMNRFGREIIIV